MKKLLSVFLFFFIYSNLHSQDKWTFIGTKVYENISNSCAKEGQYCMVLIKRDENYSSNKKAYDEKVKSLFNSSPMHEYFSFSTDKNAVALVAELVNVCNKELKNEKQWKGYKMAAGNSTASVKLQIEKYVGYTTGIKSHSIIQTIDLNELVRKATEPIVIIKNF